MLNECYFSLHFFFQQVILEIEKGDGKIFCYYFGYKFNFYLSCRIIIIFIYLFEGGQQT